MSLFPVANFVPVTYRASLYTKPVSLLSRGGVITNKGQQASPPFQASIVNADIDWVNSYPGQAVTLILQNSQVGGPLLNQILMVYVDNTLNSVNSTIIWLDTQHGIEVPAFSAGYFPVFTSQYTCNVYNGTTGQPILTSVAATTIQFCNFAVPPGIVQEGYSTAGLQNNQTVVSSRIVDLADILPPPGTGSGFYAMGPNAAPGVYYVISDFDIELDSLNGNSNTDATDIIVSLTDTVIIFWQARVAFDYASGQLPFIIPYLPLISKTGLQIVSTPNRQLFLSCTWNSGVTVLPNTGSISANLSYRQVQQ